MHAVAGGIVSAFLLICQLNAQPCSRLAKKITLLRGFVSRVVERMSEEPNRYEDSCSQTRATRVDRSL